MAGPSFCLMLHGAPSKATATPENGGSISIDFEGGTYITIFTGSAEMSSALGVAINDVLSRYPAPHVDDPLAALDDEVVF